MPVVFKGGKIAPEKIKKKNGAFGKFFPKAPFFDTWELFDLQPPWVDADTLNIIDKLICSMLALRRAYMK